MVFEPNFTKVVSSVRTNVGITQSVIELKLPTNEEGISKVYSVSAKSTIASSSADGKEVTFNGLIDFQAMYESDGISAVDYSAEFRDKFVADAPVDGELVVTSNVVDVSFSVVSGGIKVVAIVEVNIDKIESREINVLSSTDGDEVHSSVREQIFSTYLGKAYEKFDVTGDFQIDGALSVLMLTPSVCLCSVEPRDNYLSVSGKLNVDICYRNGENSNNISTKNEDIDFSWEVALDGIDPNSYIQSEVSLISSEMKVSTVVEDGVASISLFAPVAYSGYVFNENTMEVVEDLYLENNFISVTAENYDTIMGKPSVSFKDNISGTASILDTAPFIDEILGVSTNNLVLASSRVENEKVYVEGVVNSTVVYYTKETGEITSVQVEMPFAVEEKVEGDESSVVTICLANLSARSKRGKEIEVSAEICVYLDMYSNSSNMVISAVSVGERKPEDDCALYIYIVKPNQTLWDVAKDINSSQESILEQNPDVELPLKAGDKLVVYKSSLCRFQ